MPELDHHPEPVSLHDCAVCEDRGIEVESREYCQACYRGKRRKITDAFADKLLGMPFKDAMWIATHATIQSERAIAAAELALLKSKLRQAERELAEVRKDAERYRFIRDTVNNGYSLRGESNIGNFNVTQKRRDGEGIYLFGESLDIAIDAAISTPPNKGESK